VTTEAGNELLARNRRAHTEFAGLVTLSVLVFRRALHALVLFSLDHEASSHILLIPVVSLCLHYAERSLIFRVVRTSLVAGGAVVLAAIALYLFVLNHESVRDPEQYLPGTTLAIVSIWLGGFLLCYGVTAWRRAAFSLLFLLLMVPLQPTFLEPSMHFLEQGSTEIA